MSYYDPEKHKIHVTPGDTLYAWFHETAHQEQHETNSLVFRAWDRGRFYRGLSYLVTLWVEIDAYRRARRAMLYVGLWDSKYRTQAQRGLLSYLKGQQLAED